MADVDYATAAKTCMDAAVDATARGALANARELTAAAKLCEAWTDVEKLLVVAEQHDPEVEASLTFADLKGDEGVVANLALDQLAGEVRRLGEFVKRLRAAVPK